jgi:hypothetical protein
VSSICILKGVENLVVVAALFVVENSDRKKALGDHMRLKTLIWENYAN